jgi:hypothetical protein
MQIPSEPHPQTHPLDDEYSVLAVRRRVREVARELGLGTTQQAKITTATSMVARGMLLNNWSGVVTIQQAQQGARSVLEISCSGSESQAGEPPDSADVMGYGEARRFVDEARLSWSAGKPTLTLRMWIT